MGRLRDAWLTLIGRTEPQIRLHATVARIEAEWYRIATHIADVIADLNRADMKLRKRAERAAKRGHQPPTTPAPPPGIPQGAAHLTGRDRVIARLKAERRLPQGASTPLPQNVPQNGDEGD